MAGRSWKENAATVIRYSAVLNFLYPHVASATREDRGGQEEQNTGNYMHGFPLLTFGHCGG